MAPSLLFPDGWSGSYAQLRQMQQELAGQVDCTAPAGFRPRIVAGVDAGLEEQGATIRAAVVWMDADRLQLLGQDVRRSPVPMPYVPGLLSFRELPAILAALSELPVVPDLVLCDGQGIAHPRRLGIAAHLGVVTGLPSIGVAKRVLVGRHAEPGPERGACAPLEHRGERIGMALRTRERVKPVIVSPGHRMDLAQAVRLVLQFTTRYRLPEPTRLADRLASRRGAMPGLLGDI